MAILRSSLFFGSVALIASASVLGCGGDDDGGTPLTDTGSTVADTGGTKTDTGGGSDTATPGDTGGGGDTGTPGDTATADAPSDGTAADTGGDTGFTLKVKNFDVWCTVSLNGGATSTSAEQSITVPSGTVVPLVGDKASATFVWGYWRVLGDTSKDTSKTKSVTVTKDTVIQACCPFASAPTTPCDDPTP